MVTVRRKSALTRVIAAAGAVLVWFPILATITTALAVSLRTRTLRFDYLLPAELFPAALAGGGLLLWAALRGRARVRLIAGPFALMTGLLVAGQVVAVVTGLASGAREPAGWPWALVLASLAGYAAAVSALGVAGLFLLADLFRSQPGSRPAPAAR
jgi:hypothetical protein